MYKYVWSVSAFSIAAIMTIPRQWDSASWCYPSMSLTNPLHFGMLPFPATVKSEGRGSPTKNANLLVVTGMLGGRNLQPNLYHFSLSIATARDQIVQAFTTWLPFHHSLLACAKPRRISFKGPRCPRTAWFGWIMLGFRLNYLCPPGSFHLLMKEFNPLKWRFRQK